MFKFHNFHAILDLVQNYYYQKVGIDEVGPNDKTGTNSSRLSIVLKPEDLHVMNDMKNLLITNPNATEPDTTKPDAKPNVSTTSSSPPTVSPKAEQ